jgi:hypothetical protein
MKAFESRVYHQRQHVVNFSFFNFFLKEKKESKTPQISLLMLEANNDNSKAIPKSSSIKLTRANGFIISSLDFKHIVMENCNASKNN